MAKRVSKPIPDYEARKELIASSVKDMLENLNEPLREGIKDTPERVARMYMDEIYCNGDPLQKELDAIFVEDTLVREMIVVSEIPIRGWCEHHLLPYFGFAHIGYIPHMGIVGLSKLARLAQAAGRGFTIQERVTDNIADALDRKLQPAGVMVVLDCVHTCMIVRGVQAVTSHTVTSAIRGTFRDSEASRSEFYSMIKRQGVGGR